MTPRKAVAALAVVMLTCLTGCGRSAETIPPAIETISATSSFDLNPPENPAAPNGNPSAVPHAVLLDPSGIDPTNHNDVAIAVVTTMNQWDTTTDTSRLDATRRAEPWISPTLLADILAEPTPNDAAWTTLAQHHGYSTVDHTALANEHGQPPNTATTAYLQISYRITETGRDGWSRPDTGPLLARLQLSRPDTSSPWQVSRFLAS